MASVASTSGDDGTIVAETLGGAGGQKANDEARQCDTTYNVSGKHGYQDGVRCGKTG